MEHDGDLHGHHLSAPTPAGARGAASAHGHHHDHASSGRRRLAVALAIVAGVAIIEIIGAAVTGSLALLGDAGHMISDSLGLAIALAAAMIAGRPATDQLTWGFRRAEVLGALINGLLLAGVAITVAIEGIRRLIIPEAGDVLAGPMLIVALVGLLANVAALMVLRRGRDHTINLRAAYLEVLGDLLGSVAAIVAAIVILLTGFAPADAIASLMIAAMIVPRAVALLRDVLRVLTEAVPHGMTVAEIREHLVEVEGVIDVHDVHVWSITTGQPVFSAHVVVEAAVFATGRAGAVLDQLDDCLRDHFDVDHSTIQLEPAEHAAHERPRHR